MPFFDAFVIRRSGPNRTLALDAIGAHFDGTLGPKAAFYGHRSVQAAHYLAGLSDVSASIADAPLPFPVIRKINVVPGPR